MQSLIIRQLGLLPYETTWCQMKAFTENRDSQTPDECWLVQHPPVFTQGQAGKPEHLLDPKEIPVIQSDRGGQVTYHGPGQVILYVLIDLKRAQLGIKALTTVLEQSVITLLQEFSIAGERRAHAPGVYVNAAKIAALGLRIRRGCSYHGLSLNVDMDLEPFTRINPCGEPTLQVTQISDFTEVSIEDIANRLATHFSKQWSYTTLKEQAVIRRSVLL